MSQQKTMTEPWYRRPWYEWNCYPFAIRKCIKEGGYLAIRPSPASKYPKMWWYGLGFMLLLNAPLWFLFGFVAFSHAVHIPERHKDYDDITHYSISDGNKVGLKTSLLGLLFRSDIDMDWDVRHGDELGFYDQEEWRK